MKLRLLLASAAITAMTLTTLDAGGLSLGTDAHAGGKGGGKGGGQAGEGGPGNSGGAGNSGNAGHGVGGSAGASTGSTTETEPSLHGHGKTTSQVARDPSMKGLAHAAAVVGTTPANPQALESINANMARQAARQDDTTDGTTTEESEMSLGDAVDNMAEDFSNALSELFGGEPGATE